MNDYIERYVYDVTRRLPEKEREEVSKELNSNIYDMLSDNADEDEIKTVLYELGSPASLAEKYRQKPRYLISPAIYDIYIQVLKWILPLVGIIVLVIGMVIGVLEVVNEEMIDMASMISNILTKGISMGISAAFQALVWTTFGFAISERVNDKADERKKQEWKVEELPEILPDDKGRILLSESIIELVVTVVFSAIGILLCSGLFPISFIIQSGETQIRTLFNPDFLIICIPAIVIMALFGICECAAKIKVRRWTPFVCVTVIVSSFVNLGFMVYLLNRPNIFSEEFIAFIQNLELNSVDLLRFMGTNRSNAIIILISIIIVICSLVECGKAIYRTVQNQQIQS